MDGITFIGFAACIIIGVITTNRVILNGKGKSEMFSPEMVKMCTRGDKRFAKEDSMKAYGLK